MHKNQFQKLFIKIFYSKQNCNKFNKTSKPRPFRKIIQVLQRDRVEYAEPNISLFAIERNYHYYRVNSTREEDDGKNEKKLSTNEK